MAKCPYCLGEVPDGARKCQHCGEWLTEHDRPAATQHSLVLDQDIAKGVKWYLEFRIIGAIIGLVVFLVFLFAVILPSFHAATPLPLNPAPVFSQFSRCVGVGCPTP